MHVRIADINIRFFPRYAHIGKLCKDYLIDEKEVSDITLEIDPKKVETFMAETPNCSPDYAESMVIASAIYDALAGFGGMMLHAAVIEVEGRAYAFSAKSGTGKSTHIALWQRMFGEKMQIINGDKPLLREKDGVVYAYGTPFCGKERWGKNTVAPLVGICFLVRGEENSIRLLSTLEAFPRLLSQVFKPSGEEKLHQTITLLEHILERTPINELACNISLEAANLAYTTMAKSRSNPILQLPERYQATNQAVATFYANATNDTDAMREKYGRQDFPTPLVIRFKVERPSPFGYLLTLTDENGKAWVYRTTQREQVVENLLPDMKYTVSLVDQTTGERVEGSFYAEKTPVRFIRAEGLSNIRDIGGHHTIDGGCTKYGVLYRGCEMNGTHGITLSEEAREVLVDRLGIKADFDFRNPNEALNITESPLGKGIKFGYHSILSYLNLLGQPEKLKAIYEDLANTDNLPAYIHCWGGADRTGCVVAYLLAFLGVPLESILRDYELTSFSAFGARRRLGDENCPITPMFEKLVTDYPAENLQGTMVLFFREGLHLSEKTCLALRDIFLEK